MRKVEGEDNIYDNGKWELGASQRLIRYSQNRI